MTTYVPPLGDLYFVLEEVLALPQAWAQVPAFADLDAQTARQVIEEAGRFASEVLAPLNGPGDLQGPDGVAHPGSPPGRAGADRRGARPAGASRAIPTATSSSAAI